MRLSKPIEIITLAATAGMMCCIIPAPGASLRFTWELFSIWIAGIAYCWFLSSWWRRVFFLLALSQTIAAGPVITAYIQLLLIGIYLASIEAYRRTPPFKIMAMMAAGSVLLLVWTVAQRVGYASTFGLGADAAGPFNVDTAAVFFAMALPAFFSGGRLACIQWRLLAILPVAGLVLCRSTTGYLSAVAGVAVYAAAVCLRTRWVVAGCVVFGLLSVIWFRYVDPLQNTTESLRWQSWRHIIETYRAAPLGRGLGSFADIYPLYEVRPGNPRDRRAGRPIPQMRQAHNEYLQLGFEMGLDTLGVVVAYVIATLAIALIRLRLGYLPPEILSGWVVTVVAAGGFHLFHVGPTALIGCAWIGMMEGAMSNRHDFVNGIESFLDGGLVRRSTHEKSIF